MINKKCIFLDDFVPILHLASLVALTVKDPLAIQEIPVLSLGWGRSPGEGNGYPLQYSCLDNPMDRAA